MCDNRFISTCKQVRASGPEVINIFSCSTQQSMKFQLPIKRKLEKNKYFYCFIPSDAVFLPLINVQMPTVVGILTFKSRIIFMLS